MFSKKKESQKIDPEQREMFEYAQQRVKKKKNLFRHFIIFLAGAVLFIIANEFLDLGKDIKPLDQPWFVWAILIWFFVFLVHLLNVVLINRFMGKKWENEQLDKLVAKQRAKIEQLQVKVDREHPLPQDKGTVIRPNRPPNS